MSTNIEQFKQQTFALIKEQATRIKTHAKELEIKEQQIRLLKETIEMLEEERDQSERMKNGYRAKIDVIMTEVANYNQTVVQKLSGENEYLGRKLAELTPNLEESLETVKRLTKQLQVSEQSNQKLNSEAIKMKQTTNEVTKELSKLKAEYGKSKDLTIEQEKHINKLEAFNEQLQHKQKSNEKQIDNLVQKCQETVNSCEKKIKSVKEGMVKKEQLEKVQAQVEKYAKRNEDLKREVDKLSREINELQFNLKIMKEKQLSNQMKSQMESSLIEADMRSLKDSCKLGKKINEFQSKYSEILYEIVEGCLNSAWAKDQLGKKTQLLESRINQLERMVTEKETALEESKSQLQIIAHRLKTQSETIQSSYEGKILQLSIKIKKQQKALQELGIKDREFESLSEQYDKLAQEHREMKTTFENTIEQYKKQNEKLMNEVQQLIELCDQNINTKNSLNCLKHTINNLLAVIYFLYLNLVRNREARRKVYQPFIQFYFQTRNTIEKEKKGKRLLRKLRSSVTAIIALKRMEKGAKEIRSSGLLRYVERAIKYKGKIEDLSDYLQTLLSKSIKCEKNVDELIKETRLVYKWNCLHNYQKINIPANWFSNIFAKEDE